MPRRRAPTSQLQTGEVPWKLVILPLQQGTENGAPKQSRVGSEFWAPVQERERRASPPRVREASQ